MRSIFWIGCILTVLVSLLVSGAVATSEQNATVQEVVAQVENGTVPQELVVPATENTTVPVELAVENGSVIAETVANLTEAIPEANGTKLEGNATAVPAKPVVEDLVNDTLVKFVKDAKTMAQANGKNAALVAFKNPVGGYNKDKMFIFAYDYDGKVLANPINPGLIGQNQIMTSDSTGFKYVQQMRDVAKKGGFVKYQESNLMNKGAIEAKTSYVIDIDGSYWIGAGVYKSKETPKVAVPAVNVSESNLTNTTSEQPVEVSIPVENATVSDVAVSVSSSESAAPNVTAVTA